MQHARHRNNDIPLSRRTHDGKGQAAVQRSQSKETFQVGQDKVRTLGIQDRVQYGSGYLKNHPSSIEAAGTQSNQTLPMASQHSDANIRMQIKLTKRESPTGDPEAVTHTDAHAEALRIASKEAGESRADSIGLQYVTQTEPLRSPSPRSQLEQ